MLSIPKSVMGYMCGISLLGCFEVLYVSAETLAKYESRSERAVDRPSQLEIRERLGEIRPSDVLRIEGGNNLVKDPNGKEPRLMLDPNTPKNGSLKLRDRIEGK